MALKRECDTLLHFVDEMKAEKMRFCSNILID